MKLLGCPDHNPTHSNGPDYSATCIPRRYLQKPRAAESLFIWSELGGLEQTDKAGAT